MIRKKGLPKREVFDLSGKKLFDSNEADFKHLSFDPETNNFMDTRYKNIVKNILDPWGTNYKGTTSVITVKNKPPKKQTFVYAPKPLQISYGTSGNGGWEIGSLSTGNTPVYSEPSTTDVYSSTTSNQNDTSSKRPLSYYEQGYAEWERRAEQAYTSLTRNGTRTKKNGAYVKGSTDEKKNGILYSEEQESLRQAQKQMSWWREQARKAGYTLKKSNYETVTVSYRYQ
jgi:hypothetical protein